jgi:NAD(P)H dehydrogenase (quinone)
MVQQEPDLNHPDVLVILAHPSNDSLCAEVARAYAAASRAEVVNVHHLEFDWDGDPRKVDEKADAILEMQTRIHRAKHVAFVYPMWWGTAPASLKAFIDHAFSPGFAFQYVEGKPMPLRLLKGRSARIFMTLDAPKLWHWLVYRGSGTSWLKWASLWFSGFKVLGTLEMNGVRTSTEAKRKAWISQARRLGERDFERAKKSS